ncbi:MAG: AAA family ATPase [Acidimicrobiales bacterium]
MAKRAQQGFQKPKRKRYGLYCGTAVLLLLALYGALLYNSRPDVAGDKLKVNEFRDVVGSGQVRDARILDYDTIIAGHYDRPDGAIGQFNVAVTKGHGIDNAQALLDENNVPYVVDHQFVKQLVMPATILIPALIMIVIFIYLLLSYSRGEGLFAVRSGARRADAKDPGVTFANVAGQDAAVAELREIRDFLTNPGRFKAVGATVPRGILLYGPPGCGKTLLARAVAGEAGAAFYSISGSDFVEMYVGVGAARVRELFREARRTTPSIIFIDELDSVGRRRSAGTVAVKDEQDQALNQILAELDGFSPLDGIIVIGATNRPDVLDPALLRPGRFDRSIGLERPDEEARHAILALHVRGKPLQPDVDLAAVAHRAVGLSAADLASVANEAALLAARAGKHAISSDELDAALTRILDAPERQRRLSMRSRTFTRSGTAEERVTFADVAGIDEALEELAELKHYLTEPERFVEIGARPPRGVLLSGPPGCGKTLLARALATEANAAFFSVAATEFVEVFVGEGSARVRDLFAEARSVAPAIVFLDEIDAVGTRRGGGTHDGSREREQTLNQILIELDGFDVRAGVIVVAATNRPEILDPALVRAGRFDRHIALGLPDRAARSRILEVHTKHKRMAPDVDVEAVAALTQGFSGADLANVLNEAALLTARRQRDRITMAVVEEAVERVGAGLASARRLAPAERKAVAYHEAGHALVGQALPGAMAPHKISLVARGQALGYTWNIDGEDRSLFGKTALIDRMAALLGGRTAEEMVFGQPLSGAADDLRRVAEMARWMVCELGMSEALGPLAYPPAQADGQRRPYSDETAQAIDAEVQRLVQEARDRARKVLASNRAGLDRTARALFEKETLTAQELERLVGSAPVAAPPAAAAGPRQVAGGF